MDSNESLRLENVMKILTVCKYLLPFVLYCVFGSFIDNIISDIDYLKKRATLKAWLLVFWPVTFLCIMLMECSRFFWDGIKFCGLLIGIEIKDK